MTLPNGGFPRIADGEQAATLLPTYQPPGSAYEYPVSIPAGISGHIEGSLDTWLFIAPNIAPAASKRYFDIFNATSTHLVKIRGAWVIVAQDVANTATVSIRLDWFRTLTVGTGGSQAATGSVTPGGPALSPKDTSNPALPSGITARWVPTGGGTAMNFLFPSFHQTEELQVGGALSQFNNVLPNPERGEQEMVLRQNQGFSAVQGSVVGAGFISVLVSFTVETI